MFRTVLIIIFSLSVFSNVATADLPIPRWVSVKYDANLRYGPTKDANIIYHYLKSGYPLEILRQTEEWRLVRDPRDGIEGWMHRSVLKGKRYAVTFKSPFVYGYDNPKKNQILAKLERDVLSEIKKCNANWCKITINQEDQDTTVWVEKNNLLGVYPHEIIR